MADMIFLQFKKYFENSLPNTIYGHTDTFSSMLFHFAHEIILLKSKWLPFYLDYARQLSCLSHLIHDVHLPPRSEQLESIMHTRHVFVSQ